MLLVQANQYYQKQEYRSDDSCPYLYVQSKFFCHCKLCVKGNIYQYILSSLALYQSLGCQITIIEQREICVINDEKEFLIQLIRIDEGFQRGIKRSYIEVCESRIRQEGAVQPHSLIKHNCGPDIAFVVFYFVQNEQVEWLCTVIRRCWSRVDCYLQIHSRVTLGHALISQSLSDCSELRVAVWLHL